MWRSCIMALGALAGALVIGALAGCGRGAVAVVNGRKITEEEFHQRLETMHGGPALYDMIAREILTREAEAQGVQISPKQVDDDVSQWERQFRSHDEFLRHLRVDRGQTLDQFRDERQFALMLETLATKGVEVTDAEVQEHFAKNHEDYGRPAECRLGEILVDTQEEAAEIRRDLGKPRASFDALARERSKAPSSAAGGALPLAVLEQLPDEWQAAIKGLKPGDVSQPFETEEGWRIAKVLQMTQPEPASLDDPDTRERVYQTLRIDKAKRPHELLQEAIAGGGHRVVIRWPKYKDMERQFAAPPQIPGAAPPGAAEPGPPEGGAESAEAPSAGDAEEASQESP